MKPTITKLKDARGRITGYRATLGPIGEDGTCDGNTPAAAIELCETACLAALRRLDSGTECRTWCGHTYAIVPTSQGWAYWLDTLSGGRTQGAYSTHEECNARALHHLAQHVWTHDCADDAAFTLELPPAVRGEIAQWIRFQRAYSRHAATGKSDTECHRLACEDSYKVAS